MSLLRLRIFASSLILALALLPAACSDDEEAAAPEVPVPSQEDPAAVAQRVLPVQDAVEVGADAADYQIIETRDVSTPERPAWQVWIHAPAALDHRARGATTLSAAIALCEREACARADAFLLPSPNAVLVDSGFTLAHSAYEPDGDLANGLWEAEATAQALSEEEILTIELLAEKARLIGAPLGGPGEAASVSAVARMMATQPSEIRQSLQDVRAVTEGKTPYAGGQ